MTVKENVNPEELRDDPKPVLEEPVPRPETPRTGEDAQAVTGWKAKDKLSRDNVLLENEERREKGLKVSHNVF